MSQIFRIEDQSLKQNWQNINPNKQNYINENQLEQWAKMNIKIDKKHDDYVNWINKFVEDTNKINSNSTSNLQFKYQEAVHFINWIHQKGIIQPKQIQLKNNNNQFNQTGIKQQQQQSQLIPDPNQSQKQNKNNNQDQDEQLQEQQQDETNQHLNSNDNNINDNNEFNNSYNNNINSNISMKNNDNSKKIKKQEYLQQKWLENIQIIFNHYCKISYATGQDPTFQLIQHKATILNINKFMIFCKDFNLIQMKKNKEEEKITKNHLFSIFKKNSEFYKEMTFIQFKNALRELSQQIYQSKQQQQEQLNNNINNNNNNNNNNNKLNKQLKYLLIYMQIDTNKQFRNKMKKLNIHYITKINSEQKLNKKIPTQLNNKQIKYQLNNGKLSQQIQQELQQRKQNRSFRKKLLQNKCSNKSINNNKTIIQAQNEVMKDNHHYQNNIMNSITEKNMKKVKILQPPIVPKKTNSTVSQFKHQKITGYANVHRVKMGNSVQIPPQGKGYNLKLNAIVEEARKIVGVNNNDKLYQEQQQQYTNPTLRSNRNSNYELENSSIRQKLAQQKIAKIQQNNHTNINELHEQQMNELLDLKNDDEDQYLKQHLSRQSNQNKAISNRIRNKIQNLNYK